MLRILKAKHLITAAEEGITAASCAAAGNILANGRPVFVIVPDRFTLQAEKLLTYTNPALLNVRVLTFSMLFNVVTADIDSASAVLDKNTAVLFMWRAVKNVTDKLLWYRASAGHYSFAEKMFNTINQLNSSMVDFGTLEQNAKNDVTRKKMHDIATIHTEYKALTRGYTDSGGMLAYLIRNIKTCHLIKKSDIFICGFDHLSIQRFAVLSELGLSAANLTICIRQGSELETMITDLAIQHNAELVKAKTDERNRAALANSLSAPGAKPQKLDNIELWHGTNPNDEAGRIADNIAALLKSGVHPNDITVVLCDFENHAAIFSEVFEKCEIPVNIDLGIKLSETPILRFLKNLLQLSIRDDVPTFLAILKSGFLGITKEDQFNIENTVLKTDRIPKQILDDFYLPQLKKAKTMSQTIDILEKVIVKVAECLGDTEGTEDVRVSQTSRVLSVSPKHSALNRILEAFRYALPDQRIDMSTFFDAFMALATAVKVSSTPVYSDRVLVVALNEYVPYSVPYVFVAGADNLLITQSDSDLITEFDIKNLDARIEPTASMQNHRNKMHAINILTSAEKKLIISTSGTVDEHGLPNGNDLINRILEIDRDIFIPENYRGLIGQGPGTPWYANQVLLSGLANGQAIENYPFYNALRAALGLKKLGRKTPDTDYQTLDSGEVFFQKGRLTVTQIEEFFTCPYMHFLTRGLGLRERELSRDSNKLLGSLIHKIAEEILFDLIMERPRPLTEILNKVFGLDQFRYFTDDQRNRPIIEGIKKEAQILETAIKKPIDENIDFRPAFVEKKFEKENITGKADRIDIAEVDGKKIAAVIDYKTGGDVNFSYRDLYLGTRLQLPLYLSFLQPEYQPGGAFYFPLKGGLERDSRLRGIMDVEGTHIHDIINYANNMLASAIHCLEKGVIKQSSCSKKACGYCIARMVCMAGDKLRGRQVDSRKVTAKTFGEVCNA